MGMSVLLHRTVVYLAAKFDMQNKNEVLCSFMSLLKCHNSSLFSNNVEKMCNITLYYVGVVYTLIFYTQAVM